MNNLFSQLQKSKRYKRDYYLGKRSDYIRLLSVAYAPLFQNLNKILATSLMRPGLISSFFLECNRALGMEKKTISDSQITASSTKSVPFYKPSFGRLNLDEGK